MSYDERLAERIRRSVLPFADVTEKKMFGGLAFLLDGKMFCGIVKTEMAVRVGPERYEESLKKTHVRPMDFTGRPMKGYVFVEPAGCRTENQVGKWVGLGAEFVGTLLSDSQAKQKRRSSPAK